MPIFRGKPELLGRFRKGDRTALEEVYRAYVDKITNIARFGFRLADGGVVVSGLGAEPSEVADAVQEIFAKSFTPAARASYDGLRDYGPYLYAIARNVIADRARRFGREVPTPWRELERSREADLLPQDEGPSWSDEATIALARAYLATLGEELQRVHRARYVDGLSQRDAATALGISRQVLRTLEGHLREGLRRELERQQKQRTRVG